MILVWGQNWYLTYHYWPTAAGSHVFEGTLYFVPPKNARERIQQELAAVSFKEYGLQDANTLEATQRALESPRDRPLSPDGPGDSVPAPAQGGRRLGRRLQEDARVSGGLSTMADSLLPPKFSDLEPFAATWCLATEPERFAQRLAVPMDEMQAFYDAVTPQAEAAMTFYLDEFPLDEMPEDAKNLLHLLLSMVMVSLPIECWGQGERAREAPRVRPTWTC